MMTFAKGKKHIDAMKMPPPKSKAEEGTDSTDDYDSDLFSEGADADSESDSSAPSTDASKLSDAELLAEAKRRGLSLDKPSAADESDSDGESGVSDEDAEDEEYRG